MHKGERLWVVVKTQHTQPGKGGAYMQVEMKDIRDGTKLNERFRSDEKVEKVRLDQQEYQFLYADDDLLHLMDGESYEQITVNKNLLDERLQAFLQDGMTVQTESYDEEVIGIEIPQQLTFEIAEADAVVKGQTASSSYKPAVLENGVNILVPPHISAGTRVVVDTATGEYVGKE